MFFKQLTIAAILFLAIAVSATGLALAMRGSPRADAVEQPAPQKARAPGADAGAKFGADMGRPIHSLPGHKERVTSVAFSPDGQWIATAAWDGAVRLWDPKSGKEVRRLEVPPSPNFNPAHLSQITFSPDNRLLAVCTADEMAEEYVLIWDRTTWGKVHQFRATTAAFAPDGKHIACGGPRTTEAVNRGVISLHDLATGKVVREMRGHQSRIDYLAFSPDGTTHFSKERIPRPPLGEGPRAAGKGWCPGPRLGRGDREGAANRPGGSVESRSPYLRPRRPDDRRHELARQPVHQLAGNRDGRVPRRTDRPRPRYLRCRLLPGRTDPRLGQHGQNGAPVGPPLGKGNRPPRRPQQLGVFGCFFSDGGTLVSGGTDKTALVWDVSEITPAARRICRTFGRGTRSRLEGPRRRGGDSVPCAGPAGLVPQKRGTVPGKAASEHKALIPRGSSDSLRTWITNNSRLANRRPGSWRG